MERSVNDGATTYGASFQASVQYPWADYAVNMTEILGTMNQSGSENSAKWARKNVTRKEKHSFLFLIASNLISIQLNTNATGTKLYVMKIT